MKTILVTRSHETSFQQEDHNIIDKIAAPGIETIYLHTLHCPKENRFSAI